jgi:hypothetical protein
MQAVLRNLGIDEVNPGAFHGAWRGGQDAQPLESHSPIDGRVLDRARAARF